MTTYTCPDCGGHNFQLSVNQLIDVEFSDDDHEVTDGPRGDMEWGDWSHTICNGCEWHGDLGQAKKETT